jgi:hypothetical protein
MARLGTLSFLFALLLLAGCPDGEPTAVDAGTLTTGPDGGAPEGADPNEGFRGSSACYDGLDNDENGAFDCTDSDCTFNPVCCVGSSTASCCAAAETLASFTVPAGCEGEVSTCAALGDTVFFGADATPTIEGGGLVPQGGAGQGGVALGAPVDPRSGNLAVSVSLMVPDVRCTDCVDGAGVGFFDTLPRAVGERVPVRFGAFASGSRDELQIVVGDDVVQRLPLPTGEVTLTLTLSVDGGGTLAHPGGVEELLGIALEGVLVPVIYGRTDNRSAGIEAVRVIAATLERQACDTPSAIVRRPSPVLPASFSAWAPGVLGRPTLLDGASGAASGTIVILEHDGRLLSAGETGNLEITSAGGDPGPSVVDPPTGVLTLHDPWLMVHAGVRTLFFAGEDAAGVRRIYRGDAPASVASLQLTSPSAPVIDPESLEGVASIDGPSAFVDAEGLWHMIARATVDGGGTALVALLGGNDGTGWQLAGGTLERSVVRAPAADLLFAFDRDEVATPAVILTPGPRGDAILRLYYAGRRGTRWSIGLLVSETGEEWLASGEVLTPSSNGFDALGVFGPAPIVRAGGELHLVYVGTDGVDLAYGLAGPAGTLGE